MNIKSIGIQLLVLIILMIGNLCAVFKKDYINDSNGGVDAWTSYKDFRLKRTTHTYPEYRCFDVVPRCGPYNGFPRDRLFLIECMPDVLDTVLKSEEKDLKALQETLNKKKYKNVYFNIIVVGNGDSPLMIKFHGLLLSHMGASEDNKNVPIEMGIFDSRGVVSGGSMPREAIASQSVYVHDKVFSPPGASEIVLDGKSQLSSLWVVAHSPAFVSDENKKTAINYILLINDMSKVWNIRTIFEKSATIEELIDRLEEKKDVWSGADKDIFNKFLKILRIATGVKEPDKINQVLEMLKQKLKMLHDVLKELILKRKV